MKKLTIICATLVFSLLLFFTSATPINAASSTLLISEVLYDPSGTDTGFEWIELINISTDPVDIKGWTIQIAGTAFTVKVTLPALIIDPYSTILIGEPSVPDADITVPSLSIQNGGAETDGVRIADSSGTIIDTVLFDSPNTNNLPDDSGSASPPTVPDTASGHSLARVGSTDTDDCSSDFVESDTPTPGEPNRFPPVAQISAPENAFTHTEIFLDGTDSYDPDGTTLSYSWEINLGSEVIATSTDPSWNFTGENSGTYVIQLTVADTDALTSTATAELSISEDPDNPSITTIYDARALESGTTVSIEGVITAPPGILYETDGYIQDQTGGIRFKNTTNSSFSAGASFQLTGTISTVYGEKRLNVTSSKELPSQETPIPRSIDQDDLAASIGSIVSISVTIKSKNGNTLSVFSSDPMNLFSVSISDLTGIETSSFHSKDSLNITGIVSQYGTYDDGSPKVRLMPRYETDITSMTTDQLAITGQSTIAVLWALYVSGIVFSYIHLSDMAHISRH